MKTLLTITAALEAATGVALAVAPSSVVLVLLGSSLGLGMSGVGLWPALKAWYKWLGVL